MFRHSSNLAISLIALSLVTAGCVVMPEPIPNERHTKRSQQDLEKLRSVEFIPTKPIELHEAMARAVAFNLRHRVAEIESEIAKAELEKSNFELLPALEINAGRTQNSEKISVTDDRTDTTANAQIAWNVLDLGVSYARAKQKADEGLIAQEQERKALQDIIRQVNAAFWRAAVGQQLIIKVHTVARHLQDAMKASREMERNRVTDSVTAVAFRRTIVESVKQALAIRRELQEAKAELAELLNIRPGTNFELARPVTKVGIPRLPMSVENLEIFALENRPELRIEEYNERISDWRAREALYNLLPGLKLNAGQNYSSDSTNLTPNYISTSINIGFNLFQLFVGSSEVEIAEGKAELARRQRLALSMAVLTQVHMSRIKFQSAAQQMRLAHEIAKSDRKLTRLIRTDGQFLNTNYLEAVRIAAQQLQSEMNEQRSYVDLLSARADLMHAIGLDVIPESVPTTDLPALNKVIRAMLAQWNISDGTTPQPSSDLPLDQLVNSMVSEDARPAFADSGRSKSNENNVLQTAGDRRAETLFTTEIRKEIATNVIPPATLNQDPNRLIKDHPIAGIDGPPETGEQTADNPLPPMDHGSKAMSEIEDDPDTVRWLNEIAPASQGDPVALLKTTTKEGPATLPVKKEPSSSSKSPSSIHLGAFRNVRNAVDLVSRLSKEPATNMEETELEISYRRDKKNLYFYFVHTSPFQDRSTAQNVCQSLKKASIKCLVATNQDWVILY